MVWITKAQVKLNKSSFFKTVDWDKVIERDYEAPFIPQIDIEQIEKYYKRKGCRIGINRNENDKYGKLAETMIPTKNKLAVIKYNNKLQDKQ